MKRYTVIMGALMASVIAQDCDTTIPALKQSAGSYLTNPADIEEYNKCCGKDVNKAANVEKLCATLAPVDMPHVYVTIGTLLVLIVVALDLWCRVDSEIMQNEPYYLRLTKKEKEEKANQERQRELKMQSMNSSRMQKSTSNQKGCCGSKKNDKVEEKDGAPVKEGGEVDDGFMRM